MVRVFISQCLENSLKPRIIPPCHLSSNLIQNGLRRSLFRPVRQPFGGFTATIEADSETAKLTRVEATAKTGSIDTGNAKRDGHLRSDDFFNATKYPVLELKARSFKWDGHSFTAVADLTIRDVTKPVKFEGELIGTHKVNFGDGPQVRAGYQASATINRQEFGLKFNKIAEGVSVVADEVKITIQIQMSRKLGKG